MQSKLEATEKAKAELEGTYNSEKRQYSLNKIGGNIKWLDSVPEKLRNLTLESEFSDINDLGDETLVSQRIKSIAEKYSGLLASDAPKGAGTRAGEQKTVGNALTLDTIKNFSLSDVAKDPAAYVRQAMAAAQQA
jgi:hypothetical protein